MTIDPSLVESTPLGFIEGTLDLPLYDWQARAVTPLAEAAYGRPIVQVSVLAPNEGGKSSRIVAGSALYWPSVWPKGRVGITTKDSKQLNEQIIPAIEDQLFKMEGWSDGRVRSPYYRIATPGGGVIVAFTTDDAARVEGLHGSPDAPLLWIVDEAKSVPEAIFEGIDRCGYQALMYASSGGGMMGTFYDSHTKHAASFTAVRAGLVDCPHIAKEKVDRIIAKYGINNPFTRSSVFGEFMAQSDTDEFCVDLQALLNCLQSPPKHRRGMRAGFCDFGAGTAEHVLAVRDGNKIDIAAAWIESNKDATAGRFIREFRKAGLTASQIHCDASDKEIWTKLANAGWTIRRQNFGAPARLKQEYISWAAEAWLEGAIKIAQGEVVLPEDEVLKAQMVTRKKGITGQGKLCIEDKLEMTRPPRNLSSPDRADAVFGVLSIPERIEPPKILSLDGWRDEIQSGGYKEVVNAIGANAGL